MTPDEPDDVDDEAGAEPDARPAADGPSGPLPREFRKPLAVGALVLAGFGLLIAVLSIMDAISTWLKPRYADLAQGLFGLLLAGAGLWALGWIAREWETPEG